MTLVFATNNQHKLEEVRQMLPSVCVVFSLRDIGCEDDIEETGDTLEANSLLKARYVAQWINLHPDIHVDGIFADDTGMEVQALNGQPGVHTARYAGEPKDDARNRRKLLHELQCIHADNRHARFRTVITLIRGEKIEQVEGIVNGTIAYEETGQGGFGYDSLFVPEGYSQSFACLTAEQKNSISHRGRAIQHLLEILSL